MDIIRERAHLHLVDDQSDDRPASFDDAFAEHTAQAFADIADLTARTAS